MFVDRLVVVELIASMVCICPCQKTYLEEDVMRPDMSMVQYYSEGDNDNELCTKTIKLILGMMYPVKMEALFMVADSLVTGHGEGMSRSEYLGNVLGFDINRRKFIKYMTAAKVGLTEESSSSLPRRLATSGCIICLLGRFTM